MNVDVPLCRLHVMFQHGFGRRGVAGHLAAVCCCSVLGGWWGGCLVLAGGGGWGAAKPARRVGAGVSVAEIPQTLPDLSVGMQLC